MDIRLHDDGSSESRFVGEPEHKVIDRTANESQPFSLEFPRDIDIRRNIGIVLFFNS